MLLAFLFFAGCGIASVYVEGATFEPLVATVSAFVLLFVGWIVIAPFRRFSGSTDR